MHLGCNDWIKSLKDLQHLKQVSGLVQLGPEGCPIAKLPNYRDEVFKEFLSLAIVDSIDKKGNSNLVSESPLYAEDFGPDPNAFVLNRDLVDQEEVDIEDFGID